MLGRFIPRFRPHRLDDAVQHVSPLHRRRASDPHHRLPRPTSSAASFAIEHPVSTEIIRTIDNRRALYVAVLPARHRQGPRRGPFACRRPHRARARAPLRPHPVRDRDRDLARRASSADEHLRPEPRPQRPQDHPRLRRSRAEPRTAEAAAAAHRRRHPRRRARACGPAGRASSCARSISRPSRCSAAAIPAYPHRARVARPGCACASGSPTGRRTTLERFIDRHYPAYWLQDRSRRHRRARQAHPRRRSRAQVARHPYRHRRLPRRHRDHAARAEPSAPARHGGRRLRRRRRQYRRCADLDHARRHGARHHPSRARVRPGRGRGAPRAGRSPRPSRGC